MALSKRLRYEILRRDNHSCRYCGASAPDVVLTVDHVVPTALGGSDEPGNLATACRDCNSGKSASAPDAPIVADVAQDALRWAEAMKVARDAALAERDAQIVAEKAVWQHLEPIGEYMPGDWFTTIHQFLAAGLDRVEIADAAQIAMSARVGYSVKWRYFCGVCWRMVSRRQDAARALLDDLEQVQRPAPDPTVVRENADPNAI